MLLTATGNAARYRRIQIVHLRAAHGMGQEAIARAVEVSGSTVSRAQMAWLESGLARFKLEPCGGRIRENTTLA